MKVVYGIVEEIYSCGSKTRISYGIVAFASEFDNVVSTIIASVHDVTLDKQKLQALIHLCNDLELSPIHLNDVVQDFLNG